MGQEEYKELSSFLRRFIRRFKFLQGIEGLCLIAICALLLLALGPGVQQIKSLFPYAPLVYTILAALVLLVLLGWTLLRLLRRVTYEQAARYIEQKQPRLRNNLINSLQLYPRISDPKTISGFSAPMVVALLAATRKQISALRIGDLVEARPIKNRLRLLGFLFVPVSAMVLLNPSWVGETFSLLTRPLDHLPPRETMIEVEPKGIRVARGSALIIRAATSGAVPKSLELMTWTGAGERGDFIGLEKLPMESLGDGKFVARLPRLDRSVQYRVATETSSSPVYVAEAIDPPEVGNLQITLYPPAYTALGAMTVAQGNVEGLRGSSIRIDAVTTKEVTKAEILLDDGKRVPVKIDGRKLEAQLVLFQSQNYQILVEDAYGFRNAPISYQLTVRPDAFPTVDLLRPTEDLEVTGDEILVLEYGARDDFGIAEVNLIAKVVSREEKIRLLRDDRRRAILREEFKWDLGRLGLRDDDEVLFHLEVIDNDTVSGPKKGISRAVRLRLKNLRAKHQQLAEAVSDLHDRMLNLLADHLESPLAGEKDLAEIKAAERRLAESMAEALKRTEDVLQRTEKDRLADFATWSDLEALRRNLQFTREDLLNRQQSASSDDEKMKARDEISTELERMSLLSEEIGKRLKAQELAATAQDLARSQERLMDALDRLQSGDKNLDALLRQIDELAKLLSSLQQGLAQFAQNLPDDFMNMDSLRGLGFDEMFSALDEIRKKLAQGDLEGARQLAQDLFNQMASMVAMMQNSQRSAMSSAMGRMQGEMGRSTNELQDIAREQREILLGTERVNRSVVTGIDQALKEKLASFLDKAKAQLGELAELFPDRESSPLVPDSDLDDATLNQLLKNLILKLLERDFPGYVEGDKLAREELSKRRSAAQEQRAQRAETTLRDLKDELNRLMEEPAQALNDADRKTIRDLSRRQSILRDRTKDLHEKLESLFQLFPGLDPKIIKNIEAAAGSMETARDHLGELDAQGALPPEREALERLSQSQQQMQSAMQQLAQRGQLGNMPIARLFRSGRFLPGGMLMPLPGMPQFPDFNIERGFSGLDTERFRLPGKEDYRAPRSFREEILDSLKSGVPPQLKDQIERYFKNLTE